MNILFYPCVVSQKNGNLILKTSFKTVTIDSNNVVSIYSTLPFEYLIKRFEMTNEPVGKKPIMEKVIEYELSEDKTEFQLFFYDEHYNEMSIIKINKMIEPEFENCRFVIHSLLHSKLVKI